MTGTRVARPLPKRRRLASAQLGYKSASTLTSALAEQQLDVLTINETTICTSCHRNLAQRPQDIVRCARCRATTCLVCSRTCSKPPPLSMPPTPALTRSPTPSSTATSSPRRTALALSTNSLASNGAVATLPSAYGQIATGKRRKPLSLDDSDQTEETLCDEKVSKITGQHGCGRTVCRSCCYESPLSATSTCYDCLNQPYNPPMQQFDARGSH